MTYFTSSTRGMDCNLFIAKRRVLASINKSQHLSYLLYFFMLRLSGKQHRLVSLTSHVVIEGPARCGNSSASRFIRINNPHLEGRVATHLHRPFQIIRARRLGIPYLIMVRCPIKSTISHAALFCQLGQVKISSRADIRNLLSMCLLEYIDFLRATRLASPNSIVVFENYTKDPSILIKKLSAQGLNLAGSKKPIQTRSAPKHMFPSEEREKIKEQFLDVASTEPRLLELQKKATDIYDELLNSLK